MKLLIFICLASFLTIATAAPKVNLIFPAIIGAKPISRNIVYNNYSIIIYTRASTYKLVDFDLINGTRGYIERIEDWEEPELSNQDLFEYENLIERNVRISNIEKSLSVFPQESKYMFEPAAAMHNCEVSFHIGRYDFCSRKSHFIMKVNSSSYVTGSFYFDNSTYAAPITAAIALPRLSDHPYLIDFDIIAFDSTGRVFVSKVRKDNYTTVKHKIIGYVDLSSILNPLASSDASNNRPWSEQSYLMKDKPHLKERILSNAETKLMGCYIESITPMYQKAEMQRRGNLQDDSSTFAYEHTGSLLTPLSRSNYSQNEGTFVLDTSEKKTAFCLSRGLRMFEDPTTHSNIQCSISGMNQNNYIDSIGISNTYSRFIPLAFQLTSDDKFRFIHLVYSLVDYDTTNYMFCKRDGPIESNKELKDDQVMVDWTENVETKGCVRTIIHNPPDDIVFLSQNQCRVHAAFYGSVYTISPYDSSLLMETGGPKLLSQITFQINAAFAMDGHIYFFTASNGMIIVEYQLDEKCETISLKMDSAKTMSSELYIYSNFLKNRGQLNDSTFIDYREFEEGTNNTKPALMIDSSPPPVLPPPELVPATPKPSGSNSKLITIAVGIIIGGLIIAAVIYFLCLRGRDDELPVKAQSRKSKRSPSVPVMSELMVKTVRSKYQSSTGGGTVVAAKSHKSRAMSPIKSSKTLTRPSKKSLSHSKNAKKSKISVKSNKTTTQSPLSTKSVLKKQKSAKSVAFVKQSVNPSTKTSVSSDTSGIPTPRSPIEIVIASAKKA